MDGTATKTRRIPVWAVLVAFFVLPLVVIGGVELARNLIPRDLKAEASVIMSLPREAKVIAVTKSRSVYGPREVEFTLPNTKTPEQWLKRVWEDNARFPVPPKGGKIPYPYTYGSYPGSPPPASLSSAARAYAYPAPAGLKVTLSKHRNEWTRDRQRQSVTYDPGRKVFRWFSQSEM